MAIRVKDLPKPAEGRTITMADGSTAHIESQQPLLYCECCGNESSANPGDYWDANPETVFSCCGEPMRLVRKVVQYSDVPIGG